MAEQKTEIVVSYRSKDGQEIKLSFETVRKYLVSGKPEYVTDSEIMLYAGMCKARGLNPFKKDCYLIKYTPNDPAATIVSIDYYRSRAKAQEDCQGWQAGIIVCKQDGAIEYRVGSFLMPHEELLGGWFRARPKGWLETYEWSINLGPYIKRTREGAITRFWIEENQPYMIAKVAEAQGLRRLWPDEFGSLLVDDELGPVDVTPPKVPLEFLKPKETISDQTTAKAKDNGEQEQPAPEEKPPERPLSYKTVLWANLIKSQGDSVAAKKRLRELTAKNFMTNVTEEEAKIALEKIEAEA